MYIISKCLLGENCKYNGGNNRNEDVVKFSQKHSFVAVCPECTGGLPTPRVPAEIQPEEKGRAEVHVLNREGIDVTAEYVRGAEICWQKASCEATKRGESVKGAILQPRSPSCGSGCIYNGAFDGTLIEGDGIFTRLLRKKGVHVLSECEWKEKDEDND